MKLIEALEALEERKSGTSTGRKTYTSKEGAKKETKKRLKRKS